MFYVLYPFVTYLLTLPRMYVTALNFKRCRQPKSGSEKQQTRLVPSNNADSSSTAVRVEGRKENITN
jgi:hypothetical protein